MKLAHLVCGLLMVGALGACSEPTDTKDTTAETQTEETQSTEEYVPNPNWETLNVGSEVSYEPFEFKDKNGLPTGFEVELIQEIGKVEKFNVQIFDHSRKEIVKTFDNDKFAIWISALSSNPKRAKLMELSNPIITTGVEAFVLDNENNKNIVTYEDLKGKKFSVNKGASSRAFDDIARLSGGENNAVPADSFFLAMTHVYKGKADAILGDKRVVEYYMQSFPEHKLKAVSLDKDERTVVFAVKKGDKATLKKVNDGLKKVKENGTYDKLVKKWFGELS